MEPECSSPYPQVPATRPYPEPTPSSPHNPSNSWRSILIFSSHLRLGLPNGLFPQASPPTPCAPSILPHTRHMPPHLIRLDFTTRTILGKEYRSFSSWLRSFLHSPVTSSLLGPNTLFNTQFSNTLSLRSSLSVSDQVSQPYKITGKIILLYILIFKFLDSNLENKRFCKIILINIYFAFLIWIIRSLLYVYTWNTSQIFMFQCSILTLTNLRNLHNSLWESKTTNSLIMGTFFVGNWCLRHFLRNSLLLSLWSRNISGQRTYSFLSHCPCLYIYVHYNRHLCSFSSIQLIFMNVPRQQQDGQLQKRHILQIYE